MSAHDAEYHRAWRAANPGKVKATRDRYAERHPDASRAAFLKCRHGMTQLEWDEMWRRQSSLCYLCERPLPTDDSQVHIDHDQSCCPATRSCARCRRGLAHRDCNRLIGFVADDPDLLELIARNLRSARSAR